MDIPVCFVCNSPVCQECADKGQCHCEHKQPDPLWSTLCKKTRLIGQGEESHRARRLLRALQQVTNYAPCWVTPLSETLKHVPELSWRNSTTCIYCTCFDTCYLVYRVTTEKQDLGKAADEKEAVALLLPAIHALQCPATTPTPLQSDGLARTTQEVSSAASPLQVDAPSSPKAEIATPVPSLDPQ